MEPPPYFTPEFIWNRLAEQGCQRLACHFFEHAKQHGQIIGNVPPMTAEQALDLVLAMTWPRLGVHAFFFACHELNPRARRENPSRN